MDPHLHGLISSKSGRMRWKRVGWGKAAIAGMEVAEPTADHGMEPTVQHVAEDTEDVVDMEDMAPTYGPPPEVDQPALRADAVVVVQRLPRRAKAL